jgi:hypothetical protein
MTEARHAVYFGQKGFRVQITKVGAEELLSVTAGTFHIDSGNVRFESVQMRRIRILLSPKGGSSAIGPLPVLALDHGCLI